MSNENIMPASAVTSGIQYSYLSGGTWKNLNNQIRNTMDGIKIQTSASSAFYLQYRTLNKGVSYFYPFVKSTVNDYAGSSGKPIQQLEIQAFKKDGTKLTSGIIVMYRTYTDGKWLPWVSNADPEWMRSVHKKYNLDGTLDTSGFCAGIAGKNISGVEIRVYEESSIGDFTGGEANGTFSYMVDSTSNWNTFERSALASHIDGVKIQTSASKGYYLTYMTWNEGQAFYYPEVKSTVNDYAGYPGKPIQRLSISAYKNDGTKLASGVIVMYRAYVDGRWLPWVSNADPEWMRNVQSKYSLGGTLDTSSSYAGIDGKNISGIEIRIFEEGSLNAGAGSFDGNEVSLSTRYMVDSTSKWTSFTKSAMAPHMDGLEIRTTASQSFYLTYKTWNAGQAFYYPEVTSTGTDYAGSPGKPIQRLSISVYKKDGTKLTSGVVVMYRAYVDGRWLPWVSNADPEYMRSVKSQYNLDGALDVNSSYAGIDGKNIAGIEIRAFEGQSTSSIGNLSGNEVAPTLSYIDSSSTWHSFSKKVSASNIDGIKIQIGNSKPYYLLYRTWNAGKSYYYPSVKSTENDYAGSPGKRVQLLNIQAYRNDGTKITTGVVVMYRVYADGRWLPWVSNADPEWMRSVKRKYDLDGTLDTSGYYAGIDGKNIGGVEIRIFEEKEIYTQPTTPTGKYKIIQAPFISQLGKYPTGCESVTAVMALRYAGFNVSVDKFIDSYLDKSGVPFDPKLTFGGNPRSTSGYGCYAPVIKKALDRALAGSNYTAQVLSNVSLSTLCSQYIDKNIPVILWATMYMNPPYIGSSWMHEGNVIRWIAPEHCLLLVGYDDTHYIFNDPLQSQALTYYTKAAVEAAYKGLYNQAIVIQKGTIQPDPIIPGYVQPTIPSVKPEMPSIRSFIPDIRGLETAFKELVDEVAPPIQFPRLTPSEAVLWITNLLRADEYNDLEWAATTGRSIDQSLLDYIKTNFSSIYNHLKPYIRKEIPENKITRNLLSDGDRGFIDFAHLAATLETYLTYGAPLTNIPRFWASWGGDLATGMGDTTINIAHKNDADSKYKGKTDKEIADATIGKEGLRCNYTDFCSDFDAYKISRVLKEKFEQEKEAHNIHLLSETLDWYYSNYGKTLYSQRFKWILEELECGESLDNLKKEIKNKMNEKGGLKLVDITTVAERKGGSPTEEVFNLCCDSFANYIYTMWYN